MGYLLLIAIVVCSTLQSIITKEYQRKVEKPDTLLFTCIVCFAATAFFTVQSGFRLHFVAELLPYSIGFAIAYGAATIGAVAAIGTGPLSVTMLIGSYSLLIPTFYGIFFLHDSVKLLFVVGLVLLLVSLFLINFNKNESMHFSRVWLVYVLLYFVGNGMCSTVQKMQQVAFEGAYKSEFMIVSLVLVGVSLLVFSALRGTLAKEKLRGCLKYSVSHGLANGLLNYLVMVVSALIPASVLFPGISAGGIVLTFICALTLYKERLSTLQLVGYLFGTASVVLLNL